MSPPTALRPGTLERHIDFPSRMVAPRPVTVWLPPGYAAEPARRYPVLYMHDGQNLYESPSAFGNAAWEIDQALLQLGPAFPRPIVVGVWNTPLRRREYMPQKPYAALPAMIQTQFVSENGGPPISDAYLKFLVEELKPFVDANYRTQPEQPHTVVMGSSMGGLISLYAISQYPAVFGGAGCVSTHWPIGGAALVQALAAALPSPATHRLYFDFGTEGLDADYEPFQRQMDDHLRRAGYTAGQNWLTRKFEGAAHNEAAWRVRVHLPLEFLLRSGH